MNESVNQPVDVEDLSGMVERYIEEAEDAEGTLDYSQKLAIRMFASHPGRIYDFLSVILDEDQGEIIDWSEDVRLCTQQSLRQLFEMLGIVQFEGSDDPVAKYPKL